MAKPYIFLSSLRGEALSYHGYVEHSTPPTPAEMTKANRPKQPNARHDTGMLRYLPKGGRLA